MAKKSKDFNAQVGEISSEIAAQMELQKLNVPKVKQISPKTFSIKGRRNN
jgi:hypothetical protein